jgi:hypothetical protein
MGSVFSMDIISISDSEIVYRWILNHTCESVGVRRCPFFFHPQISMSEEHAKPALHFGFSFTELNGRSDHTLNGCM